MNKKAKRLEAHRTGLNDGFCGNKANEYFCKYYYRAYKKGFKEGEKLLKETKKAK